jgi:hypothetical protein
MAKENKTKVTAQPAPEFLAAVEPAERREDAQVLCALMQRLSGEPPRMWGPTIVGFGARRYRYPSGREGETLEVGFSPRKPALVLYLHGAIHREELLARFGKFSHGKSCIYVKRLADIDMAVLQQLVVLGLRDAKAAHAQLADSPNV